MRRVTLAIMFLTLASCGKRPTGGVIHSQQPTKKFTIALFSAPWCPSCKVKLPAIQALIASELGDSRSRLTGLLYVPTGNTPGARPTQEVSDSYRAELGMKDFTAKIDPWRCTTYKALMEEDSCELPAGLVLAEDGTVVTRFPAGATTFVPENIVAFLKAKLNE